MSEQCTDLADVIGHLSVGLLPTVLMCETVLFLYVRMCWIFDFVVGCLLPG